MRTLRDDGTPGAGLRDAGVFSSAVQTTVGLYAVLLTAVVWHTLIEDFGVRNELAGALAVSQALAVFLCLLWPVGGWWMALVASSLAAVVIHPAAMVWPAPCLASYVSALAFAGFSMRPRALAQIWAITLLAGLVLVFALPGGAGVLTLLDMTVLSGAVLVAAGALRGRHEAMGKVARAERLSGEEQARRALLEERARIARELHDVVAHHMSVIAIQAEAAPYRVADPPQELARSFVTIRASALEALTELHRILGLLRDESGRQPGPQPTLADLGELVARVRDAGMKVELAVTGPGQPVPPGVGLSAYRIAQEALSNALRHAPGAEVRVEVAHLPECLRISVVNDRPAAPSAAPGSGHGLLGMKERAAMLGGELTAGPRADGGYAVVARLPLGESEDA